ncbi:hypothetical protein DB32_006340 [Sandaracinus amylolyticus]|uniref:Uncharacterized protein n=1 Tax=Sandaracinus amylolyticus TaxID=927083 RepID=A0A0F6YME9_9BACT|nr:hypothetical protein DB32_006340 [Sandaracinus amylolyticus]
MRVSRSEREEPLGQRHPAAHGAHLLSGAELRRSRTRRARPSALVDASSAGPRAVAPGPRLAPPRATASLVPLAERRADVA